MAAPLGLEPIPYDVENDHTEGWVGGLSKHSSANARYVTGSTVKSGRKVMGEKTKQKK